MIPHNDSRRFRNTFKSRCFLHDYCRGTVGESPSSPISRKCAKTREKLPFWQPRGTLFHRSGGAAGEPENTPGIRCQTHVLGPLDSSAGDETAMRKPRKLPVAGSFLRYPKKRGRKRRKLKAQLRVSGRRENADSATSRNTANCSGWRPFPGPRKEGKWPRAPNLAWIFALQHGVFCTKTMLKPAA